MIKAIIFDFYGVICSDEYWQLVKEDKSQIGHFHLLSQSVNLGKISWLDFIKKIAQETNQSVESVNELYKSQKIDPRIAKYIDTLRETYKTALLTNASQEFLKPLLKDVHLDKIFDEVIISSEVGLAKPDPKIFEYALDKLGVEPEEAVFIDDLARHTESAKQLGINVILYENFEDMKVKLEEILTAVSDN